MTKTTVKQRAKLRTMYIEALRGQDAFGPWHYFRIEAGKLVIDLMDDLADAEAELAVRESI